MIIRPDRSPTNRSSPRFFESHDPTQGMRQRRDVGTQYRSAIYYTSEAQHEVADKAKACTTNCDLAVSAQQQPIAPLGEFYYAEPNLFTSRKSAGYCPDHGTGVSYPVGYSASEMTAWRSRKDQA